MDGDMQDMGKIKRSLMETGLYEENLSAEEMLGRYNAIQESKKSAAPRNRSAHSATASSKTPVVHKQKYNPPFYFSEELKTLDVKQRKEKIMAFHDALHRKIHERQRKSLLLVPWGKPISAAGKDKFTGSLLKQEEAKEEEEEDVQKEVKKEDEIYISHSGRQTKRKLYSEDALFASATKKPKSPQVQNKSKGKTRLTNEEIMKRSSLFKDHPNKYTDKIFNKLVDEDKKRQQEEDEMERFRNFEQLDDAEEEELMDGVGELDSTAEDMFQEESSKRKKSAPPSSQPRKRQNYSRTPSREKSQEKEVKQKNPFLPDEKSKLQPPRDETAKENPKWSASPQGRPSIRKKKQCPICGKAFDSNKLEEHASSCGETVVSPEEPPILRQIRDRSQITCDVCDKIFLLDSEYSAHIAECIGKKGKQQ